MPKRDPETLRPLKSDKAGGYTPVPVAQTKTAADIEGGAKDEATSAVARAEAVSAEQAAVPPDGKPGDVSPDEGARAQVRESTPAKKKRGKNAAAATETTADNPSREGNTPSDAADDLLADVEAFAAYLAAAGLRVVQVSEKDGMHRTFYPNARGGYFGLFILLLPATGNPREKWSGPLPEWIRALREAGYMAEPCFGSGQAQDLIERYRQFDDTPRAFRR